MGFKGRNLNVSLAHWTSETLTDHAIVLPCLVVVLVLILMSSHFGYIKILWTFLLCRESKKFKLFNGLHSTNSLLANGHTSNLAMIQQGTKSSISIKGVGKSRAMLTSGGGDLLSNLNGKKITAKSTLVDDQSVVIEEQPDATELKTSAKER